MIVRTPAHKRRYVAVQTDVIDGVAQELGYRPEQQEYDCCYQQLLSVVLYDIFTRCICQCVDQCACIADQPNFNTCCQHSYDQA